MKCWPCDLPGRNLTQNDVRVLSPLQQVGSAQFRNLANILDFGCAIRCAAGREEGFTHLGNFHFQFGDPFFQFGDLISLTCFSVR